MTALVDDPTTRPIYTSNRETDAHRALTRGLAEYLASLAYVDASGRALKLDSVLDDWAEPEDLISYPCGVVYSPERGEYEPSGLTTEHGPRAQTPDGYTLIQGGEFALNLYTDLFCTDPDERTGIVQMVEDGLLPVTWMYGARLALPHYFGAHAEFALIACTYIDDVEKAQQRLRIAHLEVQASVPRLRARKFPEARTQVRLDVGTDALPTKKKGLTARR